MKNIIILIGFLLLIALPFVSADVILQEVNQTSGIILTENPAVKLVSANVEINFEQDSMGYLKGYFKLKSNEKKDIKTRVYLKARGQDCYGDCWASEHIFANFDIYGAYEFSNYSSRNYKSCEYLGKSEPYPYACSLKSENYATSEGNFTATEEFLLKSNETILLYVEQYELVLPFYYYLDSLTTFESADYEKITITGNVNVTFNDKYPVKLISDEGQNKTWVWEYSNLNTKDENLKDILIITPLHIALEPELSFWQKIVIWFKNLF